MIDELNRRQFLSATADVGVVGASRALFPQWMPRLVFRGPEATAVGPGDVLVCIFLRGGLDGV